MDIVGALGSIMSGLGNGKRMFGVGLLTVLMMSAAGCTELLDQSLESVSDFEAEYWNLYPGDTSEVTFEIYHGESLVDATANYTIVIELDHVLSLIHI